jgi:hypothetical protein
MVSHPADVPQWLGQAPQPMKGGRHNPCRQSEKMIGF